MPRLEDSLKITIKDEPEPEPHLLNNSGGSDMPNGQPVEAGAYKDDFVEKFMDADIPLEDSLPNISEPQFVMKPPPRDEDLFEEPVQEVTNPLAEMIPREVIYPMDSELKKRTPTGKLRKPKGVNSNGKKRKAMTDEHKAKLAFAREKALAKRQANAKLRKEEREKLNPPPPKVQEVSEPEPEVVKERPPPPTVPAKKRDNITREDLEEISLKTIIAMETMRKQRKEEKKKKKAEEQYKDEVMQTIKHAKPSWITTSGVYSDCF